jgi:hypothetical protein
MQWPPVPIMPMVICREGKQELKIKGEANIPAVIPVAFFTNDRRVFGSILKWVLKKGGRLIHRPPSLFGFYYLLIELSDMQMI